MDANFSGNALRMRYIGDDSVFHFFVTCNIGITPFGTTQDTTDAPYSYSQGFVLKRSSTQGNVLLTTLGSPVIYYGIINENNIKWSRIIGEYI